MRASAGAAFARRWMMAMRGGDFDAALALADDALVANVAAGPCSDLPRHMQWVWNGRPLAGRTVLVRCYHGLGDTIQFARLLPLLDGVTRETIVWAQPELLPLLATLAGKRRLLPLHDGTPDVDYDVDIEISELMHALRVTRPSLPTAVPYFDVHPARRLSDRFSIGVVAEAGRWKAQRCIPPHLIVRFLHTNNRLEFFSLQLESPLPGMTDASTPDLLVLARRLRALDLVISVDTMVAHLAGALGAPTWTLLPSDSDWRWMDGRCDSPWYPTMRLFRQRRPGDWESVLEQVRAALPCVR